MSRHMQLSQEFKFTFQYGGLRTSTRAVFLRRAANLHSNMED